MENLKNIKDNYLTDLGSVETSKLDELALSILDEVIENIENGDDTIEGRKPQTRREYFMLITICAQKAGEQLIEIARKAAKPNGELQEITISFRGKKFQIKVLGGAPTNIA